MAPPPPTADAAPSAGATPSIEREGSPAWRAGWIDGAGRDLALYIGTPLLLLPLVFLLNGRPGLQDLLLYAGGFGALGHHLPGMMRAYGDRALFRRFRLRFVLAPLFLLPVCIFFSVKDLSGVILVTFFWTNWHSLMQIFGFARIYDAKSLAAASPAGSWGARLDHALCLVWISSPLLQSDGRLGSLLEIWYRGGGPLISPGAIEGARTVWWAVTAATTALWVGHALAAWRAGRAPNPAKIALFTSSFAFWWFCMAVVDDLLVGIALFDIVHDVQYLALVWTFNKARVAKDPAIGGFSRFLFRGRMTLAGVYVGLVVAYGSIGFFSESISEDLVRRTLLGVLAASALLHFYYDGFIWKVREESTRKALSMAGGGADIRLGGALPGWTVHGSKWLLLVIPLAASYWWEVHDERDEREWRELIVETVPESSEALTALASVMDLRQETEAVFAIHRRAIEKKPTHPVAHNNLGVALFMTGQVAEAEREFQEAIRLFPRYAAAHRHLGTLLFTNGRADLASEHFQTALEHDPRDGKAYAGLGAFHAQRGERAEAMRLYEEALRHEPDERTALNGLGWILATHPDASLRDGARAVELGERLLELNPRPDPLSLDTVAAAYAETGRIDEALSVAIAGIDAARATGSDAYAALIEAHMRSYERGQPWRGDR